MNKRIVTFGERTIFTYYEEIGTGFPILMIHGNYADHKLMKSAMEPVFSKIDGFKRIYFDLPGMGKSGAEHWINNADTVLELIYNFTENVIGSDDFLVMSESYGCYLARGLYSVLRKKIKGLLFIAPVVFSSPFIKIRFLDKRTGK